MRIDRGGFMLGAVLVGCLVLAPIEASAFGGCRRGPGCGYGNFDVSSPYYLGWYGYCTPGAVPFPAYYPPCYRPPNYPTSPAVPPASSTPDNVSPADEFAGKSSAPTRSPAAPGAGVLYVKVPAAARVYVNGLLTKATGESRRYVCSGLNAGATYKYQVRVELPGADKPLTETQTVILSAGTEQQLTFDLNAAAADVPNVAAKPGADVTPLAPSTVR